MDSNSRRMDSERQFQAEGAVARVDAITQIRVLLYSCSKGVTISHLSSVV